MARQRQSNSAPEKAQAYQQPDSNLPARPEIGAQAHFKKAMSAPFPAEEHRQIAVTVIDPRENELMVVKKLEEGN